MPVAEHQQQAPEATQEQLPRRYESMDGLDRAKQERLPGWKVVILPQRPVSMSSACQHLPESSPFMDLSKFEET